MWTPLPSPKRGRSPKILGPCLLWPNGWWMDQDGTWYRGRPQPRRLCIRRRPSPFPKGGGASSPFSAHFYCGQTAGCIKMPLRMEVGLNPGDFVLDGCIPSPPPKFSAHIYYSYCDFVRSLRSRYWLLQVQVLIFSVFYF